MVNNYWLNRTECLLGKEKIEKIKKTNIVVFGLGGVGSYVVEGLVRSGIQNIAIIDNDTIDLTNINRQLIATTENIGNKKVDVQKTRILQINPEANVIQIQEFINEDNINKVMTNIKNSFSV